MRTAGVGETSNYHATIYTNARVDVCTGEQVRCEQIQVKCLSEILHRHDGKERSGVECTTTPDASNHHVVTTHQTMPHHLIFL